MRIIPRVSHSKICRHDPLQWRQINSKITLSTKWDNNMEVPATWQGCYCNEFTWKFHDFINRQYDNLRIATVTSQKIRPGLGVKVKGINQTTSLSNTTLFLTLHKRSLTQQTHFCIQNVAHPLLTQICAFLFWPCAGGVKILNHTSSCACCLIVKLF